MWEKKYSSYSTAFPHSAKLLQLRPEATDGVKPRCRLESYEHVNTLLIHLFDISHGPARLRLMHCPRQKNKRCFCLFYPKRSENKLDQSAQNVFNTVFHQAEGWNGITQAQITKSWIQILITSYPVWFLGAIIALFQIFEKSHSQSRVLQGSQHQSLSSIFLCDKATLWDVNIGGCISQLVIGFIE